MPAPGFLTFGGVECLLRREDNGLDFVPVGEDQFDDQYHPESNEVTRHYHGTTPVSFACEVITQNASDFGALVSKRGTPQTFGNTTDNYLSGSWSMVFKGKAGAYMDGTHTVQAEFLKV
jgi:hypothetical protein